MYGKFLMVYFWQPKEKKPKSCQKAANTDSFSNIYIDIDTPKLCRKYLLEKPDWITQKRVGKAPQEKASKSDKESHKPPTNISCQFPIDPA